MPNQARQASGQIQLDYPLDRWPPPAATIVLSLQWLVILVPGLLVLGEVVALAWGLDPAGRVAFLQRLLLVTGLVQAAQVLWGHRLPGLVGPAAVLLVGVLATIAGGPGPVFGAMALGGALTAAAGFTGLAARLGRLYTPPVLASTLLLVCVSLAPTMRDLLYHPAAAGAGLSGSFIFGLGLVLAMLLAQQRLKGLASSAVILLGLVVGSVAYYLIGLGPLPAWRPAAALGLPSLLATELSFNPGVVVAFCLCYLALIANELGSIETTGRMIGAPGMDGRANRAVAVSGLGGLAAGLAGVLGPVTYSVSPAVMISTRSASRWTLLPAAGLVVLLSLWPGGLSLFQMAPAPVVGAVLLSLMAQGVFAALHVLQAGERPPDWSVGVTVGTATLVGIIVSFIPAAARQALHPFLQPILANGFVLGLITALVLEHLLLRRKV
ncbi:MAG: xanthine permease [Desulfarculus sp.]|nr:MAG: xanthine permease [Desulfarculus sp.]